MDDGFDEILHALAAAEPAEAGEPPRRPPAAVGAGELGFEPQPRRSDQRSLTQLIREVAGAVLTPIHAYDFNPETEEQLRAAGIRSVVDVLRLSDNQMKKLGVDDETRQFLGQLRQILGLRVTR